MPDALWCQIGLDLKVVLGAVVQVAQDQQQVLMKAAAVLGSLERLNLPQSLAAPVGQARQRLLTALPLFKGAADGEHESLELFLIRHTRLPRDGHDQVVEGRPQVIDGLTESEAPIGKWWRLRYLES
ncbi:MULTISPECIES: hypothetical protein [unclassified Streptomyces]|uniref:hypothetical protein n=1 Tax=unclassified Streptomyces TaxID=2593676 RepID=UPI0033ADA7D8